METESFFWLGNGSPGTFDRSVDDKTILRLKEVAGITTQTERDRNHTAPYHLPLMVAEKLGS